MATYAASTALAFDYNAANGTTGSFTPSGSDIAVLAMVSSIEFGSKTLNFCRYPNSSGTDLTRIGSDYSWNSTACLTALWEGVGVPASSTTLYAGWASSYLQSAIAGIAYSGVDQTTPFSGGVDNSGLVTSVTTTVASVTVTGCTAGQTIVAMVAANADNVTLSAFTAVSGTTLRASDVTGTYLGVAVLEKVATGSSETLSVNVNCGSSAILSWAARGIRVNDAAGGGGDSTITAAAGAATASSMAGSSTASTTASGASGAATTSTMAGSGLAVASFTPAAGAATASSRAGSSTATGSTTQASGAATASTAAGSSTAVASITGASGAATAATMSSDAGAASITPADGQATAGTLAGSSVVVASFVPAAGLATAATLAGPAPVADATGGYFPDWPMPRRRKRAKEEPPALLKPEQVIERQEAIEAKRALRRAEAKDRQLVEALRLAFAEQDALERAISDTQEAIARQIEDDEEVALLLSLAS